MCRILAQLNVQRSKNAFLSFLEAIKELYYKYQYFFAKKRAKLRSWQKRGQKRRCHVMLYTIKIRRLFKIAVDIVGRLTFSFYFGTISA